MKNSWFVNKVEDYSSEYIYVLYLLVNFKKGKFCAWEILIILAKTFSNEAIFLSCRPLFPINDKGFQEAGAKPGFLETGNGRYRKSGYRLGRDSRFYFRFYGGRFGYSNCCTDR